MYTYCPNCLAVFQVSAAHLGKAGGMARCGECREIFSAIDYLYEELADARQAVVEAEASTAYIPDEADALEAEVETAVVEEGRGGEDEPGPLLKPLFTTGREQHSVPMRDILSGAAIGILLLLLGMQWVYFNRADLATDVSWRPTMERLCELLHCSLPLHADLSSIEIVNRDVRQHPMSDDALLINATFENRAGFTQPYPVLEISFTDQTGDPVAVRRFRPAEYLGVGTDPASGMSSNRPVQVVLEVLDPGEAAISFQFDFL